jgi:hypothetical protein
LPYLEGFAELEWHVGQIAIEVEARPLTIAALTLHPPKALPDLKLTLQPGLRYLMEAWPIDALMKAFLSQSSSDQFTLDREHVRIELRGARGAFGFARLDPADFSFRRALARGASVGAAAETAFQADGAFDLTGAFSRLFAEGLVVAATSSD